MNANPLPKVTGGLGRSGSGMPAPPSKLDGAAGMRLENAVFCFQSPERLPESIRAAEITDFSGLLGKIPTNAFQKLSEQKGSP